VGGLNQRVDAVDVKSAAAAAFIAFYAVDAFNAVLIRACQIWREEALRS